MTMPNRPGNGSAQADSARTPPAGRRVPWWVSIVVLLGVVLLVTGAVISKVDPTLLTSKSAVTDALRVYADYVFARNLAVALLLVVLLMVKAQRMLAGFMVLTALIQTLDSLNDLARGDWILVPGLVVFALVFLLGATRLFGKAIWRTETWRD
jgi:hypothetical protein